MRSGEDVTQISAEEIGRLEQAYRRFEPTSGFPACVDNWRDLTVRLYDAAPALIALAKSAAELRMMLNDAKDEIYEIRKSRDAADARIADVGSIVTDLNSAVEDYEDEDGKGATINMGVLDQSMFERIRRAARLLSPDRSGKNG